MGSDVIAVFAVSAYLLARAAEGGLHLRNYPALIAAGAEELIPRQMRRYYAVSFAIIPAALAERLALGLAPDRDVVILGLVLMSAGVLLRMWAIASLGTYWTMRCLGFPGLRPKRLGPYRLLDNPEYISRLIDGIGVALVLGGVASPLVYAALMLVLQRRIARTESRQLDELSAPLDLRSLSR